MQRKLRGTIITSFFVILYGSGFIFTQLGLENSSPIFFLVLRFFLAFCILFLISMIFSFPFPKNLKEYLHIAFAGSLTVGVFSLGVFMSISYGVSGALNSLVIALQPILVTVLALTFLKEEINKKMYFGLVLGFLGVFFVIYSSLEFNVNSLFGVFWSVIALLGLSFGNLYQKKYCENMNLYTGGAIQTFSSTLLVLPFLLFEEIKVVWNSDFIVALFYMVIVVSIGALSLLYIMIKQGEVSKVASVFYLIPVSAVIFSYILFDDKLQLSTIVGIVTIITSILLINQKKEKN